MVNTNDTFVSKHQLLDYISKRDFNDFVAEMRDFRELTGERFNTIEARLAEHDKRFDKIDRRLDRLGDDFRIQVGAVLDQFKEYMQISKEYIQGVEERLTNKIADMLSSMTKRRLIV